MAFNIGAGFAQMGQTISTQAGAEALEMQKSDLQTQRDQLAAATAHGYKTQEAVQGEQLAEQGQQNVGQIQAAAASKLATVNAAAAKVQNDFQTGLTKLQGTNAATVAKISASAETGAASIQAQASMANIKAQLAQGDIQVGPDGTLLSIDKTTHKATVVTDDGTPNGNPVKGVVPGLGQLLRDGVNANNEQLRALTIRYDNELKGPQAALNQALKSGAGPTDPTVIDAQKAVDSVKDEYKPAFDNLNGNMNQFVGAIKAFALPGVAPKGGGIINAPPPNKAAPKFTEGDTLHQGGHIFKVINGKPVDQGPDPAAPQNK